MDPVTGSTAAVTGTSTTAMSTTATPTAAQQSQFDAALAQAQLGMDGAASNSATETPTQLLLYNWFETFVTDAMQSVDEVRQEASQDDD